MHVGPLTPEEPVKLEEGDDAAMASCGVLRWTSIPVRWGLWLVVAALAAMIGPGCGGFSRAALYEGPTLTEPAFRLGVADVIAVEVKDNPTFSATHAAIRLDGNITLPFLDDVHVVGLTPAEVRLEVTRRLEAFIKQPVVTVSVAELNSYDFYVLGNVKTPNRFDAKAAVTVLQALAMAGDVTPYATPENIVVIRRFPEGQRRIAFDYPAVVAGTRIDENIWLQSGDVVYVP